MLNCDCSTCKPPSKFFRSHELEYQKDATAQAPSTSIKVAETSSMLMNLDYESVEQSEATAEERKLTESVKSQMTGKFEMKTANIGHCGHYSLILFSILSYVILFHICY
ncbi:hypothetical protein WUBG_05667 [Wuchereria bancrofti]|uniref:Uncharacterized protein n=1 Tax=Wuchereria bancrofti TaxID=6293 RepID=J9EMJ9_WUCBA|nr:hypothetical protein WUBG_05667 [Wuchereria bancrofti]